MSNKHTKTWLVPRWGGTAATDWYPAASDLGIVDRIVTMPDPQLPRIGPWTSTILTALQAENDLSGLRIVTHSVGCHALMKALELLPDNQQIDEVIMVAAWWSIDRNCWDRFGLNWEDIAPWIGYALDGEAVRRRIRNWRVVIGTNDALSPDYMANAQQWVQTGVDTAVLVNDGKHFNGLQEEQLFRLLRS